MAGAAGVWGQPSKEEDPPGSTNPVHQPFQSLEKDVFGKAGMFAMKKNLCV